MRCLYRLDTFHGYPTKNTREKHLNLRAGLFLQFPRKGSTEASLPFWVSKPGVILLKRHAHLNKNEPLVDQVEILDANAPVYACPLAMMDGKTLSK